MKANVWAIILNYNGGELLYRAISSLRQSHGVYLTILAVDNASSDGSYKYAQKHFPDVRFIANRSNRGFSAGNNVGICYALAHGAEYIFLLNNDAHVLPDTIKSLLVTSIQHNSGITCPVITFPNQHIWYAGAGISWWRMRVMHNMRILSPHPYHTDVATGCAMLIRKEVFAQIGIFNESYFLYYEDADFSVRARRAGYAIMIDPTTKVIHDEVSEQSSRHSNKIYYLVLSGLIFFHFNAPRYIRFFWYPVFYLLRRTKNAIIRYYYPRHTATTVARAYKDYPYAKRHYQTHSQHCPLS